MFKNVFSFEGRIRRKDYFWRGLGWGFIYGVLSTMFRMVFASNDAGTMAALGIFGFILWLPFCVIFLSLGVRRSHDIGNSGWFVLIPFYGLWLLFKDGDKGPNEYGADPKAHLRS